MDEYLHNAAWTKSLREVQSPVSSSSSSSSTPTHTNPNSTQNEAFRNNANVDSVDPQRIASRKTQRDHTTIYITDEEDEDKYQRRNITQLFYALGLMYALHSFFFFLFHPLRSLFSFFFSCSGNLRNKSQESK